MSEFNEFDSETFGSGENTSVTNAGEASASEDFVFAEDNREHTSDVRTETPEVDSYLKEHGFTENTESEKPVKKKKHIFEKALAFVAAAVLFGAVACGAFLGIRSFVDDKKEEANGVVWGTADTGGTETESTAVTAELTQTANVTVSSTAASTVDVSSVAAAVMPSVVAINCYEETTSYYGFYFGGGSSEGETSEELAGSGSGIIIGQNDTEVLIVTNYHVIEGASRISIEFVDGNAVDATVKGTASSSDLAVVSVAFADMQSSTIDEIRIARIGNSDEVEIGQMAIAIGNALGYGQSVTVGYISAKDRQITVDNVNYTLIQTDAAINPGNSGGALLNINGEVIGINSVKYSDSSVEGMGFAIPISNITDLIEELSTREVLSESERGYLGIQAGKDVTSEHAALFGISAGVYVNSVEEDSPADKAGIEAGDIITKIDDTDITCMTDLTGYLSYTKAGTKVTVTVERASRRGYETKEITVTLGNRPTDLNS